MFDSIYDLFQPDFLYVLYMSIESFMLLFFNFKIDLNVIIFINGHLINSC